MKELELVILTRDLPALGLKTGDVGTVVFVHRDGAAYEVEFTTMDGGTIGVETLRADEVAKADARHVLRSRAIA